MTTFSVDNFVSSITKSGARSNLFNATVTVPSAHSDEISMNSDDTDKLQFLCNATVLPGLNMGEIPIQYMGRTVYFPGDITYGEWTTTILNDEEMKIRIALNSWLEVINGTFTNKRSGTISQQAIEGTGVVRTFGLDNGADGKEVQKMTLVGLWPSMVDAVDLNWDSVNAIETFTCTWQYRYLQFDEPSKYN